MNTPTILIIEDGDEYLDNLSRFVSGPRYLQAHDAAEARALLAGERVDILYLDMRFDRIARERLVGDHTEVSREHNGDGARAWRFLQNNQGLFILADLAAAGLATQPVILAYDFAHETARWQHLCKRHPNLHWVADDVTGDTLRALFARVVAP